MSADTSTIELPGYRIIAPLGKGGMASVYLADTLCRMHRSAEAWPHYQRGFRLAPNDVNLIALGLQCLWDEEQIQPES